MYRSQVRVLGEQCAALTVRGTRCLNRAMHRSNACQTHGGSLASWVVTQSLARAEFVVAVTPAVATQLVKRVRNP